MLNGDPGPKAERPTRDAMERLRDKLPSDAPDWIPLASIGSPTLRSPPLAHQEATHAVWVAEPRGSPFPSGCGGRRTSSMRRWRSVSAHTRT